MTWQPELDELRARERMAREMGGADKVEAPARRRPAHGARAHRPAGRPGQLPRDRRHRRQGRVRRRQQADQADAGQLRHGPRQDRRPAGGGARRRLHGARRLGRRHHPGEADPGRAHGQRAARCRSSASSRARAAAARSRPSRPPGAPTCRAGVGIAARSTSTRRQHGHRAGGRAGPGLGGRPRRGAAGGQPLLGDDEGHLGACSSPARRWWRALGQKLDKQELGGWEIQCAAGAVDHAVDTEEEAFALRAPLPVLSALVGLRACRRAGRAHRRSADRREEMLFDAIPRDRRKVYRMRPIIEAVVDQGSLLRDGPACSAARSSPASRGSTGCRSRSWPAIPYLLRRRLDGGRLRRRSCASSTWPRPSICRSSICATAPAS